VQNPPKNDAPNVPGKGTWYLVTITQASKRELFCKQVSHAIAQEKLQDLIFSVEMPKESVYQNLILLEVSSLKAVRDRLQQLDTSQKIKIDPKPLTPELVNRMLGRQK
jgi:hypothetical protein